MQHGGRVVAVGQRRTDAGGGVAARAVGDVELAPGLQVAVGQVGDRLAGAEGRDVLDERVEVGAGVGGPGARRLVDDLGERHAAGRELEVRAGRADADERGTLPAALALLPVAPGATAQVQLTPALHRQQAVGCQGRRHVADAGRLGRLARRRRRRVRRPRRPRPGSTAGREANSAEPAAAERATTSTEAAATPHRLSMRKAAMSRASSDVTPRSGMAVPGSTCCGDWIQCSRFSAEFGSSPAM